jgi:hypothetical protein
MLHKYLLISLVIMLLAFVNSVFNVDSEIVVKEGVVSEENSKVSEPKAIECYQGTNILADNFYYADDCPLIEGIKKVTCETNVTSCYANLNSQLKVQLGCDTQNYCDSNKLNDTKKVFVALCCQTGLCNCDIKATKKKREL